MHNILFAENQNLKVLFNMKNCISITFAKILKFNRLQNVNQHMHRYAVFSHPLILLSFDILQLQQLPYPAGFVT